MQSSFKTDWSHSDSNELFMSLDTDKNEMHHVLSVL